MRKPATTPREIAGTGISYWRSLNVECSGRPRTFPFGFAPPVARAGFYAKPVDAQAEAFAQLGSR